MELAKAYAGVEQIIDMEKAPPPQPPPPGLAAPVLRDHQTGEHKCMICGEPQKRSGFLIQNQLNQALNGKAPSGATVMRATPKCARRGRCRL